MRGDINSILKEVLERVKPSKEESLNIKKEVNTFLEKLRKKIKEKKIDAEIFVGGSFAKNTVIKKDHYDIDIFLRFDKKYKNEELSGLAAKALVGIKNSRIHGSRDYFRIKIDETTYIELVPVKKIKNQKDAENITDLTYSHVNYINKKSKSEKIKDDIRIAKAFCFANGVYGAESYVNGFSGYALELLICYYGSFLNFVKAMTKVSDKLIIDIEKDYKNKQEIMMDVNSAKLASPIILIDPTYKQRNALAALSTETFEKFKEICKDFLKNPSMNAFELKKIDLEKIKKNAQKNKNEFILLEAFTDRQEGDVAGSKLLKFHRHLEEEIQKLFVVKDKGFEYNKGQNAIYFFVVKNKGESIFSGPSIKDVKNVKAFKQRHKKTFLKKNRIFAREKIKESIKEFISSWKNKNSQKIMEMGIGNLKVKN